MVIGPMLMAGLAALAYVIWDPPSADLAAQTFRAEHFEREGLEVWTSAWYGGIHLPGYSLLFPPLAALTTPQIVGAVSALASAGLFGALAARAYGPRARLAVYWFAAATAVNLLTGRLTFALGVAVGLAALLALQRGRPVLAAGLTVATALATPLAALFLALAGAAVAIARRPAPGRGRREWGGGALVAGVAVAAIGALAFAFPTGGVEPWVASSFHSVPLFALVALALVPREMGTLRWGIGLYLLLSIALFAFDNPVGGNAARLGALFGGPVLALALAGRRPVVLAVLAVPLVAWQWSAPVRDLNHALGDPSVEAAFHAPLVEALDRRTGNRPARVHVLATRNRWEAVHVAERYPLARGWLRQGESDDFDAFEDDNLTPRTHRAWLRDHAAAYVAVPLGVDLDYLAEDEAELIARDPPYLDLIWESPDWRLYEVAGEPPLVASAEAPARATAEARLTELGDHSFTLATDKPGDYLVRLTYTPYWQVTGGDACVLEAGDWTRVEARSPSLITVEAGFDLEGLLRAGDGCSEYRRASAPMGR